MEGGRGGEGRGGEEGREGGKGKELKRKGKKISMNDSHMYSRLANQ